MSPTPRQTLGEEVNESADALRIGIGMIKELPINIRDQLMKRLTLSVSALLGLALAVPAFGGGINLSGPHYNLNIIGVENPKTQPLTGSNRHTIFVPLVNTKATPTNIWLTPGPFDVCDGNGFDPAVDCSGALLSGKNGAVFQLPCDTNITTPDGCTDAAGNPLPPSQVLNYTVWLRALGKPGGNATMTLCAVDPTNPTVTLCNTGGFVQPLVAHSKKTFTNVTSSLTVLHNVCFIDPDVDPLAVTCEDVSLFSDGLVDFSWQYQNTGLRLAQIRFYPVQ